MLCCTLQMAYALSSLGFTGTYIIHNSKAMCELQKLLLHQAGLHVVDDLQDWSDSSTMVTMCIISTATLRDALQLEVPDGHRYSMFSNTIVIYFSCN
jgi:hypothetical protein